MMSGREMSTSIEAIILVGGFLLLFGALLPATRV
jgi:hypothetical protein